MKLVKNNQNGRSLLTNSFFIKMVQMRRCFQARCTKPVHEEKNIQKMCRFKQESGRSMIEMLGVLAIIGVLSIGGIAGYSKAMEKHKLNKFMSQLKQIVSNLYLVFESEKDFGLLVQANITHKLKIYPDEMYRSGGSSYGWGDISTVYNAPLQITPAVTSVFDGYHPQWGYPMSHNETGLAFFEIRTFVPSDVCISLLTYNWNDMGVFGMGVEDNIPLPNTPGRKSGPGRVSCESYGKYDSSEYSLPFTLERATKVCMEQKNPFIYWYFKK